MYIARLYQKLRQCNWWGFKLHSTTLIQYKLLTRPYCLQLSKENFKPRRWENGTVGTIWGMSALARMNIYKEMVDSVDKAILCGSRAVSNTCRACHETSRVGAANMDQRSFHGPLVIHEQPGVRVDTSTAHMFCKFHLIKQQTSN